MSHNFLIRKDLFSEIHFHEELSGYGHEDTLFGFELLMAGKRIEHIENPVLHGALATNAEFLRKTKSGIQNLVRILTLLNEDPEFINYVTPLRKYFTLRKSGIHWLLSAFAPLFIPIISWKLRNGWISLWLFNFLKLLQFSALYKGKKAPTKET